MFMQNIYYYIYFLIDPRTCQPFYIGKGKHIPGRSARWRDHLTEAKRWNERKRGNTNKLLHIQKLLNAGLEPECAIIVMGDDEIAAFVFEQKLIKHYGRLIDGSGILTNLTVGGEGVSSRSLFLAEARIRRSRKYRGKHNPMYGKKHTQETKKAISKTRKEHIRMGVITPHKHTESHKQNLRENNPGGMATSKQIYQIDGTTGDVIKIWPSARQAALALEASLGNITHCANTNKHCRTKGYFWRWVGDLDVENHKLKAIDELTHNLNKPHNPHGRCGSPNKQH